MFFSKRILGILQNFQKKISERLFGGCSEKKFFFEKNFIFVLAVGRSGAERRRSRSGVERSPTAKTKIKCFFKKKKVFSEQPPKSRDEMFFF